MRAVSNQHLLSTVPFLLAVAAVVSGQQSNRPQTAGGRILLASVVDRTGRSQVDLGPDDFVVSEDGDEREILDVHIADYPVALLVDDAPGMGALGAIKSAVSRFIARIGVRPVALGTLSNPSQMIASLEDDRAEVLARVAGMTITSGAPLALPAVAHAAQVLRETGAPFSAIIIVTGRPIDATRPVEGDLLPSLLDSGATIHVIESRPSATSAADRPLSAEVPDLLRVLSDQTHGQYAIIFSSASYAIALDRLADRLSAELMVEYLVPADSTAGEVQVGVRRPGARVLGLGVNRQ